MLKQEKSKRGREEEIESEAATTSVPQKSAVAHAKPPGENILGASGGSALTHTLSAKVLDSRRRGVHDDREVADVPRLPRSGYAGYAVRGLVR